MTDMPSLVDTLLENLQDAYYHVDNALACLQSIGSRFAPTLSLSPLTWCPVYSIHLLQFQCRLLQAQSHKPLLRLSQTPGSASLRRKYRRLRVFHYRTLAIISPTPLLPPVTRATLPETPNNCVTPNEDMLPIDRF